MNLIETENLVKHFPLKSGLFRRGTDVVHAVDNVSLSVRPCETVALVGESGCGKTTLGRLLIRLIEPTGGAIRFNGQDITKLSKEDMKAIRPQMQIVFQDPFASLNPRKTIRQVLSQPFHVHQKLSKKLFQTYLHSLNLYIPKIKSFFHQLTYNLPI